jgi:hypothetical protein
VDWELGDPNFGAGGPSLDTVLVQMESLAPRQ